MARRRTKPQLRVRVVTLADEDAAGRLPRALVDPIVEAWPRTEAPVVERSTFADLASLRTEPGVALVVAGDDCDITKLSRIVDTLHTNATPAVVLTPPGRESLRRAESSGVLIEQLGADPRRIACQLHTLAERQGMIVEQASALRTSLAAAGGAQGEIERVHEELQLAATVQRDCIPRQLPTNEQLDVAVLFRPAGYVSGDIFDAVRLDKDRVGFLVADAMGHGVPAALMTMIVSKGLLKSEFTEDGIRVLPPAEAMEYLNREMCERQSDSGAQRFVTAVYAVLDERTGRTTFCLAGHPAALIVRASGEIEKVEATGPLLGVFDAAEFEQTAVDLGPGDSVVLYSDGFETAFPSAEAPGKPTTEYLDHLTAIGDAEKAPSLMDGIFNLGCALDNQAGSLHQDDDLTIVAFRRLKAADEAETRSAA